MSNLVKIDEEMRPGECPQTDTHTHTHTHTRTDAKRFYYLSHAICYSYGADKNKIKSRVAKKKRSRQRSVEVVWEEEVKLEGIGFVKEVGFKPGVKERGSYRCTEW